MTTLLHFRDSRDETSIIAAVKAVAADHGYVTSAGPGVGSGNVAELLAGIATGEVATVLLADIPRDLAIDFLRSQQPEHPSLAEALTAIADALDEARRRERRQ